MEQSLLEAALGYAKRGWRVFPVQGKLPLVSHWDKEATTDEAQITEWFEDPNWEFEAQEQPHFEEVGIGLVTGSGLVVLDVDAGHGGLDSMATLFSEYAGKLGDTPVVRTGGGGLHFYFGTDKELRNKTGIRQGIDIRGDGGFVVAPPSLHSSGNRYTWEDSKPTDLLWSWPFDLHKVEPAAPVTAEGDGIAAGSRNSVLTSIAGSMRRRGMNELSIRMALLSENEEKCRPPLPESEVRAIAKSVMRYTPENPATSVELETMAVTASQFLHEEVDSPTWLIDNVWASSAIGFVMGPPKVFKSFFALEMAHAVANGKPFLGVYKVPQARTVLLIQEESGRAAFKERVRRVSLAYGESDNLFLISNRPFNLEEKMGYERLKMEIAKVRPALLILDPLSSFVRGNQNDAQNMGNFIRSLVDLRNEFDMAVAIVHHAKKSDPKQFRGSSVLHASSEVTIRMFRFDEAISRSRVQFELKDSESPDPIDVQFQQASGTLAAVTQTQLLAMALSAKAKADPSYNAGGDVEET